MPKGKGYTPSELQTLRDEGILSPSEIAALAKGGAVLGATSATIPGVGEIVKKMQGSGAKAGTRRSRSQGYKYFPDN